MPDLSEYGETFSVVNGTLNPNEDNWERVFDFDPTYSSYAEMEVETGRYYFKILDHASIPDNPYKAYLRSTWYFKAATTFDIQVDVSGYGGQSYSQGQYLCMLRIVDLDTGYTSNVGYNNGYGGPSYNGCFVTESNGIWDKFANGPGPDTGCRWRITRTDASGTMIGYFDIGMNYTWTSLTSAPAGNSQFNQKRPGRIEVQLWHQYDPSTHQNFSNIWFDNFIVNDGTIYDYGFYGSLEDLIFKAEPNWQNGVDLGIEWKTTIKRSINGHEKRSNLIAYPIRTLQYTVSMLDLDERKYLMNYLMQFIQHIITAPYWPFARPMTSALSAGNTTVYLDAETSFFRAGGGVWFYVDEDTSYYHVISTVNADSLELVDEVTEDIPAGTLVMPIFRARVEPSAKLPHFTMIHGECQINLKEEVVVDDENRTLGTMDEFPTFKGYPIYNIEPDWSSNPELTINRQYEVARYMGPSTAYAYEDEPNLYLNFDYFLATYADIHKFVSFFTVHARGRWKQFWTPTWLQDITVTSGIASADTSLTVKSTEWPLIWGNFQMIGQYLYFKLPDGTEFVRKITGSSTETSLSLDAAVGYDLSLQDIAGSVICFLFPVRMDFDKLDLHFLGASIATSEMRFQSINDDPMTTTTTTTSSSTTTTGTYCFWSGNLLTGAVIGSSSDEGGYEDDKVNDGSTSTWWRSLPETLPHYLTFQLTAPQIVSRLVLTAPSSIAETAYTPRTFDLEGSATGVWAGEEDVLVREVGLDPWEANEVKEWILGDNMTTYQYYRLLFRGIQEDTLVVSVAGVELYYCMQATTTTTVIL